MKVMDFQFPNTKNSWSNWSLVPKTIKLRCYVIYCWVFLVCFHVGRNLLLFLLAESCCCVYKAVFFRLYVGECHGWNPRIPFYFVSWHLLQWVCYFVFISEYTGLCYLPLPSFIRAIENSIVTCTIVACLVNDKFAIESQLGTYIGSSLLLLYVCCALI